jgi:hypothetical protein
MQCTGACERSNPAQAGLVVALDIRVRMKRVGWDGSALVHHFDQLARETDRWFPRNSFDHDAAGGGARREPGTCSFIGSQAASGGLTAPSAAWYTPAGVLVYFIACLSAARWGTMVEPGGATGPPCGRSEARQTDGQEGSGRMGRVDESVMTFCRMCPGGVGDLLGVNTLRDGG